MASEIPSSSATQTESKRPLMPDMLLKAAIVGNETYLNQHLGLNIEQSPPPDHGQSPPPPPPDQINVDVHQETPTEPSESALLIRSVTGMEDTVLHIISAYGHENLVCSICKKDSSLLKACNVRNETAFHHAARFGHLSTILNLINFLTLQRKEKKLKDLLRKKNCLGETALHEAARHGHAAIADHLMNAEWNLAGLVNNDFVSPLYLATARGSLDTVKNMVQKMSNPNINITPDFYSGPKKQTALHAAVLQDTELTQELLRLYSEPLGKGADETGRTPLHFIASTGNHDMANILLHRDVSLAYIQDSDGSFPVHTAARMGHVKLIVLLLQKCLDSGELLDGNGRNFLHIAIEAKKSDIIFKLLKDSNIEMFNRMANMMDNKGNTPLHLAAEHGYIDVMLSLLKNNKLDLTLQNKEGLTAFDISVIQIRESASKTKSRDILGEIYIRNRAARFSTGWFQYYTKGQMSKTESSISIIDQLQPGKLIESTIQDRISTPDARGAKKHSKIMMTKAQIVGLGSVLIATVTFAAAFTLPGGTNQDTGTPTLGRKYNFKAFVIADFSAFSLSFLSTMVLIYSTSDENTDRMERNIAMSMNIFTMAAKCLVMTLAIGLSVVLAPIGYSNMLVIVLSYYLFFFDNPFGILQHYNGYISEVRLLRHFPDRANVKPSYIRTAQDIFYFIYKIHGPTFSLFIFVHVLALL